MSYFDYSTEKELLQVKIEKFKDLESRVANKDKYQGRYYCTMTKNQIKNFQECGHYIECDDEGNILRANFCRHRFCTVCNKRYSSKKYAIVKELADELNQETTPNWIFITLTVKNPDGENLKDTISHLMKSINRFFSCKFFRNRVDGFFRSLEITYNQKDDTYHPHYHILLAVPSDYYKNPDLYAQAYEWRQVWERSARLDYSCQFHITAVKGDDLGAAVAEVAKYAVKLSQVVECGEKALKTVANAVRGRRLISFGGILRPMQKEVQKQHQKEFNDRLADKDGSGKITRYNFNVKTGEYDIFLPYSVNQDGEITNRPCYINRDGEITDI